MGYLAGMIILLSLEVSVGDLCVYSINDPIVALGEGRSMLGLRQDVLGAQVDAFLGVRYAEPPVGERRFRAAVSVDQSWQGVQRATEFGNACWQSYSAVPDNFTGHVWWTTADRRSEDCLFLNVWTPYPRPTKAPVFVFIHGGSFRVGSSSTLLYRGDTLAAVENCVVVSMNYRLGSFGFSAFYTDKEPGNLGLMDQTLALKWVKDHIKYFGGDPKRVTLIGHSAGAAGVGFHLLSPMSRNLFQRAILQSGAPNTPWAIAHKSEALQAVGKMAKELNCPSWYEAEHVEHEAIVEDTLSCLRQREPEGFFTSNWRVPIPSSVVVDGKFLLDNPLSLLLNTSLTRNKVPILIGTVDEEATLSIPFPEFDSVADISDVHQSYDTLYKNHINSLFPYTKESIQDAIDFQYRNWLDPDNGTLLHRSVIELWEDYCMVCPIREFAKYYAMTGNDVYAYNFDRQPTNSCTLNGWAFCMRMS
ncbi:acetylcholinesterase-like [Ptychodera flava]|uniref:acetylcholinesterase-like n=1 Tax=Ptychodera flava TaxID=63121 RepID=UPI00396A41DB